MAEKLKNTLASRPATVKDVARHAHVSYATASRVLTNNSDYNILPVTRDRVLHAAQELGYTANIFARSLKTQQSQLIGLCVPSQRVTSEGGEPGERNPDARIDIRLQGMSSHPRFGDFDILLIVRNEEDEGGIRTLMTKVNMIAGLIYLTPRKSDLDIITQLAARCPLVIEDAMGLEAFSGVSVDQSKAVQLAFECLVARGCKSIGMLGVSSGTRFASTTRIEAFERLCKAAGYEQIEQRIRYGGTHDPNTSYRVTSELMHAMPRLDGLILGRDRSLVGSLKAIKDFKRTIGRDLKLVSINETPACLLSTPPISAVLFPTEEMAFRSFDLLMERIRQPFAHARQILLQPRLNERESTLGH